MSTPKFFDRQIKVRRSKPSGSRTDATSVKWTTQQHNFSGGNGLPSNTNLAETQNKNRMSNKAIKNRQAVKRCRQKKEKRFKNLQTEVANLKTQIFILEGKLRKEKRKRKKGKIPKLEKKDFSAVFRQKSRENTPK